MSGDQSLIEEIGEPLAGYLLEAEKLGKQIGIFSQIKRLIGYARSIAVENVYETRGASEALGFAIALLLDPEIRVEFEDVFARYYIDEIGAVTFRISGQKVIVPVFWPEDYPRVKNITSMSIPEENLSEFLGEIDVVLGAKKEEFEQKVPPLKFEEDPLAEAIRIYSHPHTV